MAIVFKKSALGTLSGKIGDAVLSGWLGLDTVRSTPTTYKKKKKKSTEDIERKKKFAIVVKFLRRATEVVPLGYQLKRKEAKTPQNLATSYHLEHAVIGEYPNYSIDFSKVKFSNSLRPTENGWNIKVTQDDKLLEVTWMLNPFREKTTQLDDKPVIIRYSSYENHINVFGKGLKRSSLGCRVSIPTPDIGEEEEAHCWMFFTSADGKLVSETEYLGMFTIKR